MGVPVRSWAAVVVLLNAVPAVAGALAAWFVLRGQATGFRCFVALTLVLFGTAGSQVTGLVSALHPGSRDPASLLEGLGWVAMFQLAYVFPDGRPVPAWSRWLMVLWAGFLAGSACWPSWARLAGSRARRRRRRAPPGRHVRGALRSTGTGGCPGRWSGSRPRASWRRSASGSSSP